MEERILIVDDDPEILNICLDSLANESYQVVTTTDGVEALELARRENFDLVLSDIRMPSMSGLDLFDELRKIDPEQTIIMFSGFSDVDVAVEAMKRGAFDYLSKPLILDELKLTIQTALQRNQLRAENQRLREELDATLKIQDVKPPTVPLLNNLPSTDVEAFLGLGLMQKFDAHEVIVQEGNTDQRLYIVLEGDVSVRQESAELYRLGKFDCYGEMHLFRPNLSTQCLMAETPVKLLIILRDQILGFFSQKEEKLFKHFILNTLNAVYRKLRRASGRITQLERNLRR